MTFFLIASLLSVFGTVGVTVNVLRAADPWDWRNHTYSTIPAATGIFLMLISLLIP